MLLLSQFVFILGCLNRLLIILLALYVLGMNQIICWLSPGKKNVFFLPFMMLLTQHLKEHRATTRTGQKSV